MRCRNLAVIFLLSMVALSGQALITTLAGAPYGNCGYSGDGGPSTQALVCNPQMAVVDASGNIYFFDWVNHVIRTITPAGTISTIAGNGTRGTSGDGGPALSASLGNVRQIAYDGLGNLCFGDQDAYKIRCISLITGIIQGYGTGIATSGGDGGLLANASLHTPQGIVFVPGAQGNPDMYIADATDSIVRKVDGSTGIITTVAGTGRSGPLGDGGPASLATFQAPQSLAYYNGSLYIPDLFNFRIRQWNLSTGIINTVVGNGVPYFAGDGGPATAAQFTPAYVTFDPIGNMYLTDSGSRIRKVDTSGIITTYAGNGSFGIGPDNVPPSQTYFDGFSGLYWNTLANQLLISDGVNKLRQVTYQSSTTALNAAPNSAVPGTPVTLTATVSPGAATGTVNFYLNSTLLASVPLSAGQAVFNWTAAGSSPNLQAVYQGDATYVPSLSAMVGVTIQKPATSSTIASTPNPSVQNQTVTLTAAVTPATATGSVQFYGNGALLGSAAVAGGVATLTTSFTAAGSVTLYATYLGDNNNAASTSSNLTQSVVGATTTVVTSSQNPSAVGGPVTFIATVSPATATGTVQFLDGATVLSTGTLAGGATSFTPATLAQGTHSITAVYGGDANDAGSTSPALPQTVKAVTGLTLASSLNPSVAGQSVTFSSSVNPAATGTVQFADGGTVLATVPVTSGVAAFSTSSLAQGNHSISASYSGDANYMSASAAAITQTILAATTVTVVSTQNPSPVGGPATFIATVSPATATGTVQFLDGATVLGTGTLANGSVSFATSALTQGTHSITAVYGGDASDAGATSGVLSQGVKLITGLTLLSSVNPSAVGQTVTFTVNVNPAATGTVQFLDGSTVLSTVPVTSGVAAYSTSTLAQGAHAIGVIYSGDANYLSSQSAPIAQTVNAKATTVTTVTSAQNPVFVGAAVTFTATVSPSTATGTVQFLDGVVVVSTATLANGSASFTTSTLGAGIHPITAVYGGDAADTGSTSALLNQTISAKTNTTTTIASGQNPGFVGVAVTFTATVSPATATGTVQFLDGVVVLSTATLANGSASFTTTLGAGIHPMSALYSGDATNASSPSAPLNQTINVKTTTTTLTSTPNPAYVTAAVTFNATVTPATATGSVTFLDAGNFLGIGTLANGSTSFTTSTLAQGTHSITAVYTSDPADSGSTSAVLSQVMKLSAGMTVGLTPSPAVVGQTVKITANMNSAATGTVQFTDGGAVLATVAVAAGSASFSTSSLARGSHTLGVAYSGDATYMAVSTTFPETVLAASTVALASSANPSTAGQSVTFTAAVTPSTATGTVQFFDGGTLIGSGSLASGSASLATASLAKGAHSISATYGGDGSDAPAGSASLNQIVMAVTTVSLASSLNPSAVAQSVSFSAGVAPSTATGTVQFLDGSTVLGTVNVSSGSAVFTTSSLAAGAHSITASYSGDASDTAATSTPLTQTVNVAAPGAPSNLTATAAGSNQINLAWTASATSGVTYDVYGATSSGFTPSAANRIASGVTSTSYSVTGLSTSTTYYYRVTAVNSGGESAATNQATATTAGALSCHVSYSVTTQWNVGFTGALSIHNTGPKPITSWTLTWTWPGNQNVTQSWNANYTQSGAHVTFNNMSYNATIAAGATLTGVGFNASYSGSNPAPTAFYVNGTPCN